ncbi:seminal metalloprotease 1 [Zeugodacus cucurbitae]|uniref:Metalloendopeptidase n=1 Tax=Zeugodacus cucurbitae TaxID=28588 RepID=A0A0A1X1N1_ZEUCU|nr:seminal metalloprotease 1 [Zeugodacus cucurbitae]
MMMFLIFLLFSVIGTSPALPADPPVEKDPELTPGFFEGDIVLQAPWRNGVSKESRHWPNGIVYYKFMEGFFDEGQVLFVKGAMKTMEDVSCIRFVEADDNQPYFINITGNPRGCYSTIGFSGGIQQYNLQPYPLEEGCFRVGTIMHEMLHTLGFYHMQSTYNRNKYVRIVTKNIDPSHLHNFNKYEKKFIDDFEAKYDYGSILHYSPLAFSANGKNTIEPLRNVPENVMGQRVALSKGDINKLNKMYKCGKN